MVDIVEDPVNVGSSPEQDIDDQSSDVLRIKRWFLDENAVFMTKELNKERQATLQPTAERLSMPECLSDLGRVSLSGVL
jgi:hypothetical protein